MYNGLKKRGTGHLEIIISFIIFISFLSFILYYLNPLQKEDLIEGYLKIVERGILEKVGTEMISISLIFDEEQETCFSVFNPLKKEKNVSIISALQNKVSSSLINDKILIDPSPNKENVFYLYFSEDFEDLGNLNLQNCPQANKEEYQFGIQISSEQQATPFVAIPKLNEYENSLNQIFTQNYSDLKEEIGLPKQKEFDLLFYYLKNKTEILNLRLETPRKTIYSKRVPIKILNKNGDMDYGFMNIRVW